ncbi:response regulator transcription factor [Clostridium sp. YIM B02505]|uniref:Stage 0 sporulation protein A homolog n=1 Tax=Clostridium yunnanense TaxID=2800325 RepID=A0ABS1EVS0_9CLOT|nr:response regulator transcription factor [Clostridium yunnanense]
MYNLLLVEDDIEINQLVYDHLRHEGFSITSVKDGESALQEFHSNNFDLIILDIMLPKLNGKEVLKKVRESSTIPVIIISAKDSELDKILGLELGADDYITKPFSLNELNARINASLRRIGYFKNSLPKESKIQRGELTLDLDNYQLIKNGIPIDLTAKEFEIIKLLLENPKRVFTKTQLFSSIWHDDFMKDENTVMVHIRRVREKIEDNPSDPKYIKTIWGIGYKLGDI